MPNEAHHHFEAVPEGAGTMPFKQMGQERSQPGGIVMCIKYVGGGQGSQSGVMN